MELNRIFDLDNSMEGIALSLADAARLLDHARTLDICEYVDDSGMEHGWHGIELCSKFDQEIAIGGYYGGEYGIYARNVAELESEEGGRLDGLARFIDIYTGNSYENRGADTDVICQVTTVNRDWVLENLVKV